MAKNSTPTAFDADRGDKLVSAAVTVIVFAGGILSAFVLGAAAFTLLA